MSTKSWELQNSGARFECPLAVTATAGADDFSYRNARCDLGENRLAILVYSSNSQELRGVEILDSSRAARARIFRHWEGIREALRPAFDDPTEYTIQKGVGVIAMHSILPDVIERIRSRGLPTTEPSSYTKVLNDALVRLEGENAAGEPVHGLDFWATSPRGAAGSYSSSAGRRVLVAKIRQLLPSVEAE